MFSGILFISSPF